MNLKASTAKMCPVCHSQVQQLVGVDSAHNKTRDKLINYWLFRLEVISLILLCGALWPFQ